MDLKMGGPGAKGLEDYSFAQKKFADGMEINKDKLDTTIRMKGGSGMESYPTLVQTKFAAGQEENEWNGMTLKMGGAGATNFQEFKFAQVGDSDGFADGMGEKDKLDTTIRMKGGSGMESYPTLVQTEAKTEPYQYLGKGLSTTPILVAKGMMTTKTGDKARGEKQW